MDIRTKHLGLYTIIIVGVYGFINQLLSSRSIQVFFFGILITIIITLIFFSITFITKEQLGLGDGLVFLMLALVNHWQMAITTYILAFILAGIVGLFIIAIKRGARKMNLPFIPFVTITYLVIAFVR